MTVHDAIFQNNEIFQIKTTHERDIDSSILKARINLSTESFTFIFIRSHGSILFILQVSAHLFSEIFQSRSLISMNVRQHRRQRALKFFLRYLFQDVAFLKINEIFYFNIFFI